MFSWEDIRARLKRQPFTPVRFVTSNGESFDVYHPDLALVGRRYVIIGTAAPDDPATFDLETRVAILHITTMEDLPSNASPAPQDNGRK